MCITVKIWDTAGQERYHTITTSYYRGSNGIMLVYDITDRKSFTAVRAWVEQIHLVRGGTTLPNATISYGGP